MKFKIIYLTLFILLSAGSHSYSQLTSEVNQNTNYNALFNSHDLLSIRLGYSNKEVKKETNDSTLIRSTLAYKAKNESWETIDIKLRARGNNRLKNCYFAPIKIELKKSEVAGSLFEGTKKLKLMLPCLQQKESNDAVVKEYLAYRLYELITPYHFKSRLLQIDYSEDRGGSSKEHQLKGIFLEDIKKVADRTHGKIIERTTHPLAMDDRCAIQNDFFQFMIGNTDYSMANLHNQKLLFVDKNIIPIPYDFDMSGLVNASYATVAAVDNQSLEINDVTQRLFRGFMRDTDIYFEVRNEFIAKKLDMLTLIDSLENSFDNPNTFLEAKDYIQSFFEILEDRQRFNSYIIEAARTK